MRIGLLSDTHVPQTTLKLPVEVERAFDGVDLILHAGDIFRSSALDQLERITPVLAARGDGDNGAVLDDDRVKWKHILRLHGQTIWVIHEVLWPYPVALWKTGRTLAGGEKDIPDVVVFGHDHCTIMEWDSPHQPRQPHVSELPHGPRHGRPAGGQLRRVTGKNRRAVTRAPAASLFQPFPTASLSRP